MKKILIIVTILLITGCSCEKKEEKITKDLESIRFGIEEPLEVKFNDESVEKINIRGECKIEKLKDENKTEIINKINEEVLKQVKLEIPNVNNLNELQNKTSDIGKIASENLNNQNIKIDYCAVVVDKNRN